MEVGSTMMLIDVETQREKIDNLLKKPLGKGENWYLLDCQWFKQWKKYVGHDGVDASGVGEKSSHPGPLDNTPILKAEGEPGEIKDHLIDELDFVLLHEDAWNLLYQWYGLAPRQVPIVRKVVEHGMFVKHCKVEVYLTEFKLCENSDVDKQVSAKFSKADTIETVEQVARRLFEIPSDVETRLWSRCTSNTYEQLAKKENTVQDMGLFAGQVIVIEQKNEDGTWPRQAKNVSNYFNSAESKSSVSGPSNSVRNTRYGYNYNDSSAQPGVCGLSNLGNTCFMNSVIQCMSNCPPITKYFLDNCYYHELNEENPLGMRGEIAKAFGELVKNMWSGRCSYVAPRQFKMQVGRFAPQFSGYQQHDSQELLTFLLDGLHEDLNRIKKKPYVEIKDADGRNDEEVAREAWEMYLQRNDSIIVDVFHSLLKSTVVCPECPKVSVTFDPFCYLSLPLPQKKERIMEVYVIPAEPTQVPVHVQVQVPKEGTLEDLFSAVSKVVDVSPEMLVATTLYRHRFGKIYGSNELLSKLIDRDEIYVYELDNSLGDVPTAKTLAVYFREVRPAKSATTRAGTSDPLFGRPFLLAVDAANCTYDVLYESVARQMQRYVSRPNDNERWWVTEDETQDEVGGSGPGEASFDSAMEVVADGSADCTTAAATTNGNENFVEDRRLRPKRLFGIKFLNTSDEQLQDDGQPVSFPARQEKCYVVLDWTPRAKQLFYNEEAADQFHQHESLQYHFPVKDHIIQLKECLELYTTTEKLGVDDAWYCPSCKKHQQATKKFDLWTLPQILVIHLKRFQYNRHWRDKITTMVEFPTSGLDMSPYIINPTRISPLYYDLIGVCNHYGGLGGGHYTAYCQNKDDNKWYYFDDSSVSPSTEYNVVSKAAYVLFYMRRSTPTAHTATSCDATMQNGSTDEDMEVIN